MSGPRVMIENGLAASENASMQARVRRYRPSAGWYGSVAAPTATTSRCQEGRASSRLRTSATFVLTRMLEPYRSSHGRSARASKART
jgi:hypothetical protein